MKKKCCVCGHFYDQFTMKQVEFKKKTYLYCDGCYRHNGKIEDYFLSVDKLNERFFSRSRNNENAY